MANKEPRRDLPEIGQYFCEECDRYFDTEEEYREHNQKHHEEEREEVERIPGR